MTAPISFQINQVGVVESKSLSVNKALIEQFVSADELNSISKLFSAIKQKNVSTNNTALKTCSSVFASFQATLFVTSIAAPFALMIASITMVSGAAFAAYTRFTMTKEESELRQVEKLRKICAGLESKNLSKYTETERKVCQAFTAKLNKIINKHKGLIESGRDLQGKILTIVGLFACSAMFIAGVVLANPAILTVGVVMLVAFAIFEAYSAESGSFQNTQRQGKQQHLLDRLKEFKELYGVGKSDK